MSTDYSYMIKHAEAKPIFSCLNENIFRLKRNLKKKETRSTDVHDLVDIMGIDGLGGEESGDFFGDSGVDG